jgi:membrane-bound lytic murein transglycosylase D
MAAEKTCRIGILFLVSVLWLGFSGLISWGGVDSKPPTPVFIIPFYDLPDRAELCGESVPLLIPDVRERFDREFTIVTNSHAQVYLWLKRTERYFPWIEKQLASKGLPDDLKYVAVAESDLMTSALSSAGAAGPWQFMAGTAGNYGMCQSGTVDERYDFEIAASGAFKHLNKLHDSLQNWTLAVAAYNCGERRVQDEIRKQKVSSYYQLKLPLETERYIFRILAIKEVLSKPEKYGYYLPKGAGYAPLSVEKVDITLPGPITITAAAEAAGITYREMKVLNPFLISDLIPKGNITIKVPVGKGKEFEKKIAAWKAEYKPIIVLHKVGKGDTIDGIAHKYNATRQEICDWNQLKDQKVRLGQSLKIYK